MATPTEILYHVRDALKASGELPSSTSYIVQEHDGGGIEGNLKLPVVQITPVTSVNLNEFNTDLSGYVTDENGNEVGRIYHAEYQMTVQIDVITVDRRTSEDEQIEQLSTNLRNALYWYDSAGPSRQLAESVWKFSVEDGERVDDTTTTPTMRRWRQDVDLWTYEEFDTTEDYIVNVNLPNEDEIPQ
ncbi:hypothetical protein M199_gp016 [Halogranum tailed virus 1]|uniref:Uncharacterized protein n=1 Tax=Halogranum tailed virus 1 TaxID=1273749 RepID=R4TGH4_9CAUD|nr:hypothetical protein M199_gp016 [Halogranum tailed virus 1]AGM11346.1 hypothetical protein HGTV1_16 [Halogranum tailed virus 1]